MLNRCGSVNDKIGVLLAQNLPELRALHLAFCQVTGVTVKELVCTLLRISDPEFGRALSRADLFWVCYRCLPAYYHQKLPGDSEKLMLTPNYSHRSLSISRIPKSLMWKRKERLPLLRAV